MEQTYYLYVNDRPASFVIFLEFSNAFYHICLIQYDLTRHILFHMQQSLIARSLNFLRTQNHFVRIQYCLWMIQTFAAGSCTIFYFISFNKRIAHFFCNSIVKLNWEVTLVIARSSVTYFCHEILVSVCLFWWLV